MLEEVAPSLFVELNAPFFTLYSKHISHHHHKKPSMAPFKDHVQFSTLVDILIRKNNHHMILQTAFSKTMQIAFLEAFIHYLSRENTPQRLDHAELIYLEIPSLNLAHQQVVEDFARLHALLDASDKYLLIATPDTTLFSRQNKTLDEMVLLTQLEALLHHPKARFLLLAQSAELSPHPLRNQFAHLVITEASEADLFALLKHERIHFENYHQVLIPDELLTMAYLLAERYLSTENPLEKAALLLDSSAARMHVTTLAEATDTKPILTPAMLLQVLSAWTHIPVTHLQFNKFKFSEFMQNMQKRVFGQEAALTLLGQELLQFQTHLQKNAGPFCTFLFAGPQYAGKKTAALGLAEQLFKQSAVLYLACPTTKTVLSLLDMKMQAHGQDTVISLRDILRQKPYAMLMLEKIDQMTDSVLAELCEILHTGYLYDENNMRYNFRQATLILSTTLGSTRLIDLANSHTPEEDVHTLDLLQLLMSEEQQAGETAQHYSPQELAQEIMPELAAKLGTTLCEAIRIIPFLPLNKSAIENIVHLRLKALDKTLSTRFGIEFGYAPEVLRFLINEVCTKQQLNQFTIDVDKALKLLYSSIEQAIFSQLEHKNRSNQLFLHLNETGQSLRCDWLTMTHTHQHVS